MTLTTPRRGTNAICTNQKSSIFSIIILKVLGNISRNPAWARCSGGYLSFWFLSLLRSFAFFIAVWHARSLSERIVSGPVLLVCRTSRAAAWEGGNASCGPSRGEAAALNLHRWWFRHVTGSLLCLSRSAPTPPSGKAAGRQTDGFSRNRCRWALQPSSLYPKLH